MLKTILICIVLLAVILFGSAAFVAYYDFSGELQQEVDSQIYGKWKSEDKPYGDYEYFEFTPEGYTFENRFHPASYATDGKMVTITRRGETLIFKVINDSLIEREVPRLKHIRYIRVE